MNRITRVIRDLLLTALIFLFLGLVVVRLDDQQRQAMAGHPRVVDGDTLVLDGQRVRLVGIDAPELRQVCQRDGQPWSCGRAAKDHLATLIGDSKITCVGGGSDRYGRILAVCSVQNLDLNAAMVDSGYAISFGDYEAEENVAKQRRMGLWAGTFDAPRSWRQTHGGMDEAPHISDGWISDGWVGTTVTRLGDRLARFFSELWND